MLTSCDNIWKNRNIYVEGKLLFPCFLSETAMAQAILSNCGWESFQREARLCSDVFHCDTWSPHAPEASRSVICQHQPAGRATSAGSEGLRWALSPTLRWKYLPKLCSLSSLTILQLGCIVQTLLSKAGDNSIFACWFLAWIYTCSVSEFTMYKTKIVSNFLKTTRKGTLEKKIIYFMLELLSPKEKY